MIPGKLYRIYDMTEEPPNDIFLVYKGFDGKLDDVIRLSQGTLVMYIEKFYRTFRGGTASYYCFLFKKHRIYIGEYWKVEYEQVSSW